MRESDAWDWLAKQYSDQRGLGNCEFDSSRCNFLCHAIEDMAEPRRRFRALVPAMQERMALHRIDMVAVNDDTNVWWTTFDVDGGGYTPRALFCGLMAELAREDEGGSHA